MQREGVGRVRHISAKLLWLQQHVATGRICIVPVGTKTNPADIATREFASFANQVSLEFVGHQRCRQWF